MTRLRTEMPADWARLDDGREQCWSGPLHVSDSTSVPGVLWVLALLGAEAPETLEVARAELAEAAEASGFAVGELEDSTEDAGAWVAFVAAAGDGDLTELVLSGLAWKRLDDDTFVLVQALGPSIVPHDVFVEFVFDTADSTRLDNS